MYWCQIIDWLKFETRPSSLRNLAHTIPKCFEFNISGIEYKKYYYDFHISHPHNYLNVIFRYSFVATFLKNCYLAFTSYQSNRRAASFSESFNLTPLWGIWSPHPSTLEAMSTVNHTKLRFKILAECDISFYEQQPCHKNKIRRIAHTSILRFQFCHIELLLSVLLCAVFRATIKRTSIAHNENYVTGLVLEALIMTAFGYLHFVTCCPFSYFLELLL